MYQGNPVRLKLYNLFEGVEPSNIFGLYVGKVQKYQIDLLKGLQPANMIGKQLNIPLPKIFTCKIQRNDIFETFQLELGKFCFSEAVSWAFQAISSIK